MEPYLFNHWRVYRFRWRVYRLSHRQRKGKGLTAPLPCTQPVQLLCTAPTRCLYTPLPRVSRSPFRRSRTTTIVLTPEVERDRVHRLCHILVELHRPRRQRNVLDWRFLCIRRSIRLSNAFHFAVSDASDEVDHDGIRFSQTGAHILNVDVVGRVLGRLWHGIPLSYAPYTSKGLHPSYDECNPIYTVLSYRLSLPGTAIYLDSVLSLHSPTCQPATLAIHEGVYHDGD